MVARILRALALWLGMYILLSGVHFGVLYGLNSIRTGLENRWETQFGLEVIDREPPYSWRERLVMAMDTQPSIYWAESLAMSFVMSLPVALFVGLGSLLLRRARRGVLMLVAIISSVLVFYLTYLLNQQGATVGYFIEGGSPAVFSGAVIGIIQGLLAGLVLRNGKG